MTDRQRFPTTPHERDTNPKFFSILERFLQRPLLAADLIPTNENPTLAEAALRIRANHNFVVAGTGATSALATHADGGGLTLTTGGTTGDHIYLAARSVAGENALLGANWRSAKKPAMGVNIVTGSDVTTSVVWAGFKLTATHVVATDDDQFYFRRSSADNGGRWQAVTSVEGTDQAADTGVAVEASSFYRLWVELDENRVPHYYINGSKVHEGPAVRALSTFDPYAGVWTLASSARAATFRNLHLSQLYGT